MPMSNGPDFQGFARAWVGTDRRLADYVRDHPDAAEGLAAQMAQALERRRQQVKEEAPSEGHLVVSIDPSRFGGPQGLDSEAWDQLAELVKQHDEQIEGSD